MESMQRVIKRVSTSARRGGFTIVELLIVIVVIAILAAITIVSYSGIRQRAENAAISTAVHNWENTIRLYQSTTEKLPEDWTCLGQSVNDFPAVPSQSIGLGQCERNMIVVNPSPDWTSEFKTVPTSGQTLATPQLLAQNASPSSGVMPMVRAGTNGYMRGIVYSVIFDPAKAPKGLPGAYLFYALTNQSCPAGRDYRTLGSISVCALKLTTDNYANEIYHT